MTKPGLILIGAGGHAHSCIEVIEQHDRYRIMGLVGLREELNSVHLGYEVIATDDELAQLSKSIPYAFITIGHIRTARHRMRLYLQAAHCGFQIPVIIAPTAYVSRHARIGSGSIVMQGAIVNGGASVGENSIINTRSLLEHDTKVADHCHISTGSILNGGVSVEEGSFIGSGCVVKEGVSIGRNCLVGIGLTVRHALSDSTQFIG